jgi:L-aminopeptidase/D-esterase-like protein
LTTPALPAGLRIGHATDAEARTGCTVFLGPFRGASFIAGHATGTREMDALSTLHIVPRIDALLFTGGSAFGLGAANGVVDWLEERGQGYDVGAAKVPIVPAAVIFDLPVASRRPDGAMARVACDAASNALPAEGPVGAGTGILYETKLYGLRFHKQPLPLSPGDQTRYPANVVSLVPIEY